MFWIKDSGFCSVIFSFTIIFELYYRFRLTFIERGIRIIILFRKHVKSEPTRFLSVINSEHFFYTVSLIYTNVNVCLRVVL